eukprot:754433-Hanusia_phi.AAC.1
MSELQESLHAAGGEEEKERILLLRRWKSAMSFLTEDQRSFTILLSSSDPDFVLKTQKPLQLSFTLPTSYPAEPCHVSLLNEDIPSHIRVLVEKAINAEAKKLAGKTMVREILRWFDNNTSTIFQCALEVQSARTNPEPQKSVSLPSPWTPEEQRLLEAAMKQFPSTMEASERWASIASKVPGRTKKECIERFKEVKKALQASQRPAQGAAKDSKEEEAGREEEAATTAQESSSSSSQREWTKQEQQALESALQHGAQGEVEEDSRESAKSDYGGVLPSLPGEGQGQR